MGERRAATRSVAARASRRSTALPAQHRRIEMETRSGLSPGCVAKLGGASPVQPRQMETGGEAARAEASTEDGEGAGVRAPARSSRCGKPRDSFMALETTPKFGSCSSPMAAEEEALDQMIAPPDEEDYRRGRRGRMGLFGLLPCDIATNCKRRRVLLVRYRTMNTRGSVWRRAFGVPQHLVQRKQLKRLNVMCHRI
ncbi:uncharacterized protein [Lolium perenne]|uniref:uncharacterized protein isoform X2 n=1 Tax=Lolium perenne TaxID=4522 RepID=UPI0021F53B9E|nr:uncharacterized protein LOC127307698 isoform X2 [Lolium perenne]